MDMKDGLVREVLRMIIEEMNKSLVDTCHRNRQDWEESYEMVRQALQQIN